MMLLWAALAQADPVALRALGGTGAVVGWPSTSVAWIRDQQPSFSLDVQPGTLIAASVGARRPWGGLAGSVGGLLVEPGLALGLTPDVQWVSRQERWRLGLAAPLLLRVAPGVELRAPVLAEVWTRHPIGALHVGFGLGLGYAWYSDVPGGLCAQLGVTVDG